MKSAIGALLIFVATACAGAEATASNSFTVNLSPPVEPQAFLSDSPFGINTAFSPDTPDLDQRLDAMQQAGVKWGRQDFTWRRIEREKGQYNWSGYDALVEKCGKRGVRLFGNLMHNPPFYDMRSKEA